MVLGKGDRNAKDRGPHHRAERIDGDSKKNRTRLTLKTQFSKSEGGKMNKKCREGKDQVEIAIGRQKESERENGKSRDGDRLTESEQKIGNNRAKRQR